MVNRYALGGLEMSNAARTLLTIALAVGIVVACITGCRDKEDGTVKIGAITPLTGPFAVYGEPVQEGILLAVDEINSEGGINGRKIRLLSEDDSGDPKNAVNAFTKLVNFRPLREGLCGPG
jgi:branched-chain amino acid transport system substrate-binding protein